MIYSVSEVGDMADFLKAFPFVSMEDYMWKMSSPMIRIMAADNTHVEHLSEKQAQKLKRMKHGMHIGDMGNGFVNDLGQNIME